MISVDIRIHVHNGSPISQWDGGTVNALRRFDSENVLQIFRDVNQSLYPTLNKTIDTHLYDGGNQKPLKFYEESDHVYLFLGQETPIIDFDSKPISFEPQVIMLNEGGGLFGNVTNDDFLLNALKKKRIL